MSKIIEVKVEDKSTKITINTKEYIMKLDFSINTFWEIEKLIKENKDYKLAFNKIKKDLFKDEIHNNRISVEELNSLDDTENYKIIDLLLNDEEKDLYNSFKSNDMYEKYIETKITYTNQIMATNIKPALIEFSNSLKAFSFSFEKPLIDYLEKISNTVNQINSILKFDTTYLSQWAEFGWTVIEEAPISLFNQAPISQKNADTICLEYFQEENINKLLNEVQKTAILNDYIEESIELFNLGYYRPCAMLIIAYIDRVISNNIIDLTKKSRTKQIGKAGINLMDSTIAEKEKVQPLDMILIFVQKNLIEFLKKLFKAGDDFKNLNLDYINRNYLMHGWLNYKIEKIDCIKLYNALLNLNRNINEITKIYNLYK